MTKQDGDARVRLQQAALELFRERGYDRTTAAEIAARAGVTERTFFRHFPDKREVLFDGEAILRDALTGSIRDAPAGIGPLDMLFRAFRSVQLLLEENRPFSKPRHEVISATPALQERELAKLAVLTDALCLALRGAGRFRCAGGSGCSCWMAAFAHATVSWIEDPDGGLGVRLDLAERELRGLL